jgi:hypothetical protein
MLLIVSLCCNWSALNRAVPYKWQLTENFVTMWDGLWHETSEAGFRGRLNETQEHRRTY